MLYVVNKHASDQMIDYNQMNEGISGKRENMKTNQTSLFVKVASAWLHLLHCCSCSAVFQQHSEGEYLLCQLFAKVFTALSYLSSNPQPAHWKDEASRTLQIFSYQASIHLSQHISHDSWPSWFTKILHLCFKFLVNLYCFHRVKHLHQKGIWFGW